MELVFPLGGLNRELAYQAQRPYTAYDLLNVRPRDTIERRLRGGSRPMLRKAYQEILTNQWVGSTINSISYSSTTGLSLVSLASPHSDTRMVGSLFRDFGGNAYPITAYNTTSSFYVKGDASAESGSVEVLIGAPIQNLSVVHPIPTNSTVLPPPDNTPIRYYDDFDILYYNSSGAVTLKSPDWAATNGFSAPTPTGNGLAENSTAAIMFATHEPHPNLNVNIPYTVSMRASTTGVWTISEQKRVGMQWSLLVKMDDTTPAPATNGIQVYLTADATDANGYDASFSISQTVASVTTTTSVRTSLSAALPLIWVTVDGAKITAGCANGVLISTTTSIATSGYSRWGFGVGNTVTTGAGGWPNVITYAETVYFNGTATTPAAFSGTNFVGSGALTQRQKMLVSIAGGQLYREKTPGRLDPIGTEVGAVVSSADSTHCVLQTTTLTGSSLVGYTLDFLNTYTGRSRVITAYNAGTYTATYGAMPAAVTGDTYRLRPLGTRQTGNVVSATASTITFNDTAITRLPLETWTVYITGGKGAGQQRTITVYNAGTQTATTISSNWHASHIPDATSRYKIFPGLSVASFRTDNIPLMATELRGKLYIADWEPPRVQAIGISANLTVLTYTSSATFPAANFTTQFIDPYNDLVVVTDAVGSAVDGNYQISSIAEATLTMTANVETLGAASLCNIRVQRAPKVFNPIADTVSFITATVGQSPVGCPMVERYRDRLVWAGEPKHVWYMSRQGDPLDYDYGKTDDQRAVAGVSGNMGVIPEPLTSILNGNDDYFLFFCEQSIWVMRGDPTSGSLTQASNTVGCIDRMARCHAADGSVVFLSRDGLYRLLPGARGIEQLSKRPLPAELMRIDTSKYWVTMAYDGVDQGIRISLTPYIQTDSAIHWWFDYAEGSFWKDQVNARHDAFAQLSYDIAGDENSVVLLGCRDGYVRRADNDQTTDDGETVDSYVLIGPVRMNRMDMEGTIRTMRGELGVGSDDVDWSMYLGDTPSLALAASPGFTGSWTIDGLNYNDPVRARAASMFLKLSSTGQWAFERASIQLLPGGLVRKR